MIRAAAKNHSHVAVVVDPNDYDELLQHLSSDMASPEAVQYRKRLAWKAFQHCATYDSTVAEWLWTQIGVVMLLHVLVAFMFAAQCCCLSLLCVFASACAYTQPCCIFADSLALHTCASLVLWCCVFPR